MKLLDFRMPPYARIQFVSRPIKEKWEPIISRAVKAYATLERETVVHGLRSCTTTHIQPNYMDDGIRFLGEKGLVFVPMRKVGAYSGFAHAHPPVVDGKPWSYYGVISRTIEDAMKFVKASDDPIDHDALGKLLGYPDCCREFFNREWKSGYIDPIWQEAQNCTPEVIKDQTDTTIRLSANIPHEINSMLRYIGVRVIPHIPCSHDCKHSQKIAADWIALGRELSVDGLEELLELLHMPLEWNCLKGQAIVSTPIFKVATNSVPCYPAYIVQKEGTVFPDGVPNGLKFPWDQKKSLITID